MGMSYGWKCSRCGYSFFASIGVTRLYFIAYTEIADKAKKGEYGNELKELFEAYSDSAIDAEYVILRWTS